MREPIENINQLQKKLNNLQLENQILKNILDNAGISYKQELMHFNSLNDSSGEYEDKQGARIL